MKGKYLSALKYSNKKVSGTKSFFFWYLELFPEINCIYSEHVNLKQTPQSNLIQVNQTINMVSTTKNTCLPDSACLMLTIIFSNVFAHVHTVCIKGDWKTWII